MSNLMNDPGGKYREREKVKEREKVEERERKWRREREEESCLVSL